MSTTPAEKAAGLQAGFAPDLLEQILFPLCDLFNHHLLVAGIL